MPDEKKPIEAPQIINDMKPHFNRGLNKQINSRREYKEEQKRQGVEQCNFEDLPKAEDAENAPFELTDAQGHFSQEMYERLEGGEDPEVVENDIRERLERHS